VNAHLTAWLNGLADALLARRTVEAIVRAAGRRDLACFDRQDAVRAQRRILLHLVHRAQGTRFGREHDFRRIRCEADFRRLVPIASSADVHGDEGRRAFARLPDGEQPRSPSQLESAGANPDELTRWLAVSPSLTAAWRTAFALAGAARPFAQLFSGPSVPFGNDTTGGRRAARRVAGNAGVIAAFRDRTRLRNGGDRAPTPTLAAVFVNRGPVDDAEGVRSAVGDGPVVLQTVFLPEGPVAVEDPRSGGLRLLTDHGVYFEFLAAAKLGATDARRGLAEVQTGVDYEVMMTAPAGVWARRTGLGLRFERRDPPLLHLVPLPKPTAPPPVTAPPPQPAPHRRIVGIPATRPETLVHIPWSAPAGRE
jgi:hypothetical protein